MDKLQNRIRKLKNPSVLDMTVQQAHIPAHLLREEGDFPGAYRRMCRELLQALKDTVPAVRFSMGTFSLYMGAGLQLLADVTQLASRLGYYVIVDAPMPLSVQAAESAAAVLLDPESEIYSDALIVQSYIGSDALRPFVQLLKERDKDLFAVVRTANRTASELQDLLSGSRLVHQAAADTANRLGEPLPCRCGYSRVGALAAASSADSLKNLRQKYKGLFLLLDGYDYPNANAKYCSYGFDKLGHGAAACAGTSVTAAWLEAQTDGEDYIAQAVEAAERMRKNLTRYITIL